MTVWNLSSALPPLFVVIIFAAVRRCLGSHNCGPTPPGGGSKRSTGHRYCVSCGQRFCCACVSRGQRIGCALVSCGRRIGCGCSRSRWFGFGVFDCGRFYRFVFAQMRLCIPMHLCGRPRGDVEGVLRVDVIDIIGTLMFIFQLL